MTHPTTDQEDELIERVARAIAIVHGADPDGFSAQQRHVITGDELGGVAQIITDHMGPLWKMWIPDARAAISAMQGDAK